jgi:hypothetical protein
MSITGKAPREKQALLHYSGRHSQLAGLECRALCQRSKVESETWSRLLFLMEKRRKTHLVFSYALLRARSNDPVSTTAAEAATTDLDASPGVNAVKLIDHPSFGTRGLAGKWKTQVRHYTQRFQLCVGLFPSCSPQDPLTLEPLTHFEGIELLRIHCGAHSNFGRLFRVLLNWDDHFG